MTITAAATRAQWQTRGGFILSILGAAIGLGNIWRFSFVVGENGGGAFLVVYLAMVLCVGLPLLLAELAVGRSVGREAASAFVALGRNRAWRQSGMLGVAVSFIVLTYYAVIAGWAVKYFVAFGLGDAPRQGGAAEYFRAFTATSVGPVFWQALVMVATAVIVLGGVERGIERASKYLMPALGILIVVLAAHSLMLPHAGRGLAFLFAPDWSVLAQPNVYLAALGQTFFSLGLAMGVLVTYGSYIPQHYSLPQAAVVVVVGDTLFAVLAAAIIFPAVFSFGMDPAQGPGLAFVTLPEIFAQMTGGRATGVAFFALLVVAAVTSSVAMLEIPVAYVMERWGLVRSRATLVVAAAAFILGVPSALGFGVWAGLRIAGRPILDSVDFLASNILLPLSGLAVALFVGWHWREAHAVAAVGLRRHRLARLWRISVRYLAPAMIVIIVLRSLAVI